MWHKYLRLEIDFAKQAFRVSLWEERNDSILSRTRGKCINAIDETYLVFAPGYACGRCSEDFLCHRSQTLPKQASFLCVLSKWVVWVRQVWWLRKEQQRTFRHAIGKHKSDIFLHTHFYVHDHWSPKEGGTILHSQGFIEDEGRERGENDGDFITWEKTCFRTQDRKLLFPMGLWAFFPFFCLRNLLLSAHVSVSLHSLSCRSLWWGLGGNRERGASCFNFHVNTKKYKCQE